MNAAEFIYLDNHATTRCDPRVVDAMLPLLSEQFANPHSTTHEPGRQAAAGVASDLERIARCLGCSGDALTVTSGATESTNLAIFGVMRHPRQSRRKIVTVATEHPAVLDPVRILNSEGCESVLLPVTHREANDAGRVDLQRLASEVDEDTALVSVMWANNEIGVLQPMREIAEICHAAGAVLHCDATQAVGRVPVDLAQVNVDLLSCSAHKFHGPKGVGLLAAPATGRRVRLRPLCYGGGQQRGLRPGTMNPASIRGMAVAMEIANEAIEETAQRIANHRDRLWQLLSAAIPDLQLNGPALERNLRLPGNLNVTFPNVDGETLLLQMPAIAASSGSACSSVDPAPSHVLIALGLSEQEARSSLRFGLSRDTTDEEIARAAQEIIAAYHRLQP